MTLWKEEIKQLIDRTQALDGQQPTTAFYGSSSIRLWEGMKEDLSPHPVINLGFGGSSYRWCSYFFEEVFAHFTPREIILYAGDNDLGNGLQVAEIMKDVNGLLLKIKDKFGALPVSIISVKPSPDRLYLKDQIVQLNQSLQSLMQARDQGHYIDIHKAMLQNTEVRPELFLEDQLHMNLQGYEIWAEIIKKHLDEQV